MAKNASTKVPLKTINDEINLLVEIRKHFKTKFQVELDKLKSSKLEIDRITYNYYNSDNISFAFDKSDIMYFLDPEPNNKLKSYYPNNERPNCMRAYMGATIKNNNKRPVGGPTIILVPAIHGSITNLINEYDPKGIEWPDTYTLISSDITKDNIL